ncbi:restriction endonuclease [Paenibacillus xylanexedens]|uniref:restriction endonuclease n=1 Tax=Paenibacillus xylanexedens TaxID=528191 RepID=UPI0011A62B02|nr:restriction endonuclease [Paenibacillus xylanexedens]
MAIYSKPRIDHFFLGSDNAQSTADKGKALEDLSCYLFEKVPGISIAKRNTMNAFDTEEIDIALWNERSKKGFSFLPHIILLECKNWSASVSSNEVSWFAEKLESRGLDFGILIAANGITGNPHEINRAHSVVARHLSNGRRIIVIKRSEIETLVSTDDLITIIKEKLCELAVAGVVFQ